MTLIEVDDPELDRFEELQEYLARGASEVNPYMQTFQKNLEARPNKDAEKVLPPLLEQLWERAQSVTTFEECNALFAELNSKYAKERTVTRRLARWMQEKRDRLRSLFGDNNPPSV